MPKKKRFRSRFQSDSASPGPAGAGARPRVKRPRRRHGPNYQQAFSDPNDENAQPIVGEDGEVITPGAEAEGQPPAEEPGQEFYGLLEMHPNGYGFLRAPLNNYARLRTDPFVPGTMIEKFKLRQGLKIKAIMQQTRRSQGPRVKEILDIEGMKPEDYINIQPFENLTAINPEQWLRLEVGQQPITNRVIDLLAPLGRGQRALIVAPPRSGKTIMLQHISKGIATNYPDVELIVLLIDERPEEVTDMRRNVERGEVIASSLDEDVESHVRLSQLVVDRCRRLAEMGKDVFLLMDSITRLARAFNKYVGNNGPTMTGGVNIKAMDVPKKLFATARAFAEGGSLTIVGTALVDTGSRMDELIFQEFKGTGNMELVLDRKLADRRVWPAIDISQSGTRREELLHDPETYHSVTMIRRTLNSMHPVEAMEQLTKQLARFPSNQEFLKLIANAKMMD
ncbi:MAG: transcription termination factor Rho [Pirellula sp.]|jgi:transcription termination factor Rho|nr:transcription termination factor Rho [Pirellula sp.]